MERRRRFFADHHHTAILEDGLVHLGADRPLHRRVISFLQIPDAAQAARAGGAQTRGDTSGAATVLHHVSHEFRTPLSLILGPLEKMMKDRDYPSHNRYFQAMHRNAHRLLSLINELMDFGKLESGSLKLGVQAGNLQIFMEELAEEFRDWAIQKEIDFTLRQSGTTGEAWFDRQVLEKIVLNLLHNAFKYTKPGGKISLEVLSSLDGFNPSFANELVLKNEFRGSRYAWLRVADTGIGISASSIHHLFERYYRITESHLGSGVGLALVKSLALLHKADIRVYSERLKG